MSSETTVSGVNEELATLQAENTEASASLKTAPAEKNFRELERRKEIAESRNRELEARLQEMERSRNQKPDEFDSLADDDVIEARYVKQLRREVQELKSRKPELSPEDVSRIKYKDYDDVVSEENIEQHLLSNPALAQIVKSSANPYEAAYHLLKKLNTPKSKTPDLTKKLEEVIAKPRSLNEAGAASPGFKAGDGHSMADLESRRAAAMQRAKQYLGGNY